LDAADCSIHVSRYLRDAIGVISKYRSGVPEGAVVRVYAVGGDGILFDCLNGIVGLRGVELGALPYGNTCDFPRAFGEEALPLFRREATINTRTLSATGGCGGWKSHPKPPSWSTWTASCSSMTASRWR
jgi:hypothetical protein